jgi:hypothetical protein
VCNRLISNLFTAMTHNLIPFLNLNYPFTPYILTAPSHLLLFFLPQRTSKPHRRFRVISYHAHLHINIYSFTISTLHPLQDDFHQVLRGPPGRSLHLRWRNGRHQGHFRQTSMADMPAPNPNKISYTLTSSLYPTYLWMT